MQIRNIIKNIRPIAKCDDIKRFDTSPVIDKPIYGMYHVFCVNRWVDLVNEQLASCKDSGLLSKTTKLFISCVYTTEADIDDLKEIIGKYRVDFEITVALPVQDNQFEFPALEYIHDRALKEDFYIYYFHTKGVSYTAKSANSYPSPKLEKLKRCSDAWRKMMEYFIFCKHNVAINVLKSYDTYGCKFDDPIVPPFHYKYYAGNFWWSKSSYIKTLPPFSDREKQNRYWAENWLLLKTDKIFSTFNTPTELYAVKIPECVYTKDKNLTGGGIIEYLNYFWGHYMFVLKKLLKI